MAEQILDVRVGEECIIIGTLFKDMPLKPNVLQEYSKQVRVLKLISDLLRLFLIIFRLQRALAPLPQKDSFVSEKDVAWLEDDSGRIKLAGVNLDLGGNTVTPASLLTGQVVAIRGCENEQGDFEVHGIVLPNFAQQTNIPIGTSPGFNFVLEIIFDRQNNLLVKFMPVSTQVRQLTFLSL